MSDKYQMWKEEGKIQTILLSISFSLKAGVPIKEVCKYYGITQKEYYSLKKKYKDVDDATDKNSVTGFMFCLENLIDMARGYTQNRNGKEGAKGKDGHIKYKLVDMNIPQPKSLEANTYLLEHFFNKTFAKNYLQIALQEKKLDNAEKWEDIPDGSEDD